MAEWLSHSPATLKVTGSHPTFGSISDLESLESIQASAQRGLDGLCGIAGILRHVMSAVLTGEELRSY